MSNILKLRPHGAERMQLDLALFHQRIRAADTAEDPPVAQAFDYDQWREALARDLAQRSVLISMALDQAGVKAQGPSARRVAAGALVGVTLFGAGAVGALRSVVKPARPVTRLAMIEIVPPAAVSELVAATPNLARAASLDPTPTSAIAAPKPTSLTAGPQARKAGAQKADPAPKSIVMPVPRPQARVATPDLTSSVEALLASAR